MDTTINHLAARYDAAAKDWHDKIAPLGYPAAYAELLKQHGYINLATLNVLDAGAGSADFASALIALNGVPKNLTLRDISSNMLKASKRRLQQNGVEPVCALSDIETLDAERGI